MRVRLFILLAIFTFGACVSKNASPYRPVTFLEHHKEMSVDSESTGIDPFRYYWSRNEKVLAEYRDSKGFESLFVRPINTSYIRYPSDPRFAAAESYSAPAKDVQVVLSNYLWTKIKERLGKSKTGVAVENLPREKSFILEVAFTELLVSPELISKDRSSRLATNEIPIGNPPKGRISLEVKCWDGYTGTLLTESAETIELTDLSEDSSGKWNYLQDARAKLDLWVEKFSALFDK